MRLAFLCSSLEPGRDGVGDYTRRLAGELIRQGHAGMAVALHDPYVSNARMEQQEIEGTTLPVLRVPSTMPWNQRISETRNWLHGRQPDWMSLQFVPFGFHPRGLCFGLGKSLAALGATPNWHFMFHELWLGLGERSPVKNRCWGALQRWIALDAVRRLRPKVVHTQAEPYRLALERVNIKATILPLFGNIPQVTGDGWRDLLSPLLAKSRGAPPERKEFYLAGILGGVHPEWNAEDAVLALMPLVQQFQKRLVLVFIGKNNVGAGTFDRLTARLKGRAEVVVTGERSAAQISILLQCLDLGLATTPLQVIQKSGSAAAMLEHGLSLLVVRDDWHLRGAPRQSGIANSRLLTPQQFAQLKVLPVRDAGAIGNQAVRAVAEQLLGSLSRSRAAQS